MRKIWIDELEEEVEMFPLSEMIKEIVWTCKCPQKKKVRWFDFMYTSDLMGALDGEPVWAECCPEDDEDE